MSLHFMNIFTVFECVLFQIQSFGRWLGVEGTLFLFSVSCFVNVQHFFFSDANSEVLANLFHSLDIWHKSIKLTAKISAVCILLFITIITPHALNNVSLIL